MSIKRVLTFILICLVSGSLGQAQEGTGKWKYSTGGERISSSPALAPDGTIYVGSFDGFVSSGAPLDGKLHAVNPDGTQKWVFDPGERVLSSPAIGSDGTIYVGVEDFNLYAINPDGSERWTFPTQGIIEQSSPAIGSDGTIYIGSWDHNLYAVNPDGTEKWVFSTGAPIEMSPVVAADGTVYVGSEDHNFYALNPDGTLKWIFGTDGPVVSKSPAIDWDGTVYFGSRDNHLYAANPDGSLSWSFRTGGELVGGSPAIGPDGSISVGSRDDNQYAIYPDGTLKWAVPVGTVGSAAAIDSNGTVYTTTFDGEVFAINPDGTIRWVYLTGAGIESSPVIGPDGTVYVGSWDFFLHAIHGDSAGLANSPWPMMHGDASHSGLARIFSSGEATLAFPQLVKGEGVQTEIILTNPGTELDRGVITFRDSDGQLLPLSIDGVEGSIVPYSIPPGGLFRLISDAVGDPVAGYATVSSDQPSSVVTGSMVYDLSGFEVSVPNSPPSAEFHVYVERNASAETGIALANPDDRSISIMLRLLDQFGTELAEITLNLLSGEQLSRFIGNLFENMPTNFVGSVRATSENPFSLVGLRQQKATGSLALMRGSSASRSISRLVFAQLADGGGVRSEIILLNSGDQTNEGTVFFRDSNGQPLSLMIDLVARSSLAYTIPPGGVFRVVTDGAGAGKGGYAVVESDSGDSRISGTIIYRLGDFEVSVPSSPLSTEYHVFVEHSKNADTAIAAVNPNDSPVDITALMLDGRGEIRAESAINLQPGAYLPLYVGDLFERLDSGVVGTVQLQSVEEFSLIGLRQRPSLSLSALSSSTTAVSLPESDHSFTDPDAAATALGFSVDVDDSGTRFVAGYYEQGSFEAPANGVWRVFVWKLEESGWVLEATLTESMFGSSQSGNAFGESVAISGDGTLIVVGASHHDGPGTSRQGKAWVYQYDGSKWIARDELEPAAPFGGDSAFGQSVDINRDGTVIVVGAPQEWHKDPNIFSNREFNRGAAYVFRGNGSIGWDLEQRIRPNDFDCRDYSAGRFFTTPLVFGLSVDVDPAGKTLAIGGPHWDAPPATGPQDCQGQDPPATDEDHYNYGAVYAFKYDGGAWLQKDKFWHDSGVYPSILNVFFGRHVVVDGDLMVVQSPIIDRTWFYEEDPVTETWHLTFEPVTSENARHNKSIDIRRIPGADYVVVGVAQDDTVATDAGRVFLYKRTGSGPWMEQATFVPASRFIERNDYFGAAVAIAADNGRVVTSSLRTQEGSRNEQGRIYVIDWFR